MNRSGGLRYRAHQVGTDVLSKGLVSGTRVKVELLCLEDRSPAVRERLEQCCSEDGVMVQAIGSQPFEPGENFALFTMVVVGGVATPAGAVLGALFLQSIRWFLPVEWQLLASGGGVLLVLLVAPGGIGGLATTLRDTWLRWVATRHRVDAPGIKSGRLSDDDDGTGEVPVDVLVAS